MSEKTEYPTSKKLRKAREDGQVAHSKDFTQTVLILALFGYILNDSENIIKRMGELMIFPAGVLGMNFEEAVNIVLTKMMDESIWILTPFLLIVIGLGLFIEMLQTGMNFSIKAMMPSGKKLNVAANVKNLFAAKNLMEFVKSNIKIAFLSALMYVILRDALPTLMTLPRAGMVGVGIAMGLFLKIMMVKISVGYAIIAAADFAWQRYQHIKGLMMSKDEIKQEYKEAEGDQQIKHQRKHLHQEMLQEGAVNATRSASALITNPTHLAIAILYDKDKTPLPLVVAKGEGALAERMMAAARQAGVPILQNIPLAHSLMDTAHLNQYIPSELIEPVAEVLRLVQAMVESGDSK
jgi:type III secretion protein U